MRWDRQDLMQGVMQPDSILMCILPSPGIAYLLDWNWDISAISSIRQLTEREQTQTDINQFLNYQYHKWIIIN